MKQVLYFTATWCGPCQQIKPQMEQLLSIMPIRFIDVDRDKTAVDKYGVRNVPTVIVIDQTGTVTGRLVGGSITPASVRSMYNQ
jgi:thiol-disulfide isomerase/thioredoxin